MSELSPKDTIYDHIGNRLRALREQNHLNQADVAKLIGKSHQTYSNYEKATNQITLDHLYVLAQYYGVAITDLLPEQKHIAILIPNARTDQKAAGMAEDQAAFTDAETMASDRLADATAISGLILKIRDDQVRKNLITLTRSIAAA
ncbi:helix-turn-helix transcriptional regulator [Hyphomonas sp. FCG-A18]|uniref:helix-turn-helix transcriptional regulator n=1 Tax=Hyphomonas sp. FCG-A18 TaxID=3080019 RepID=UPI002B2DCA4D|nr:helix-turn-helix transcriptional regulator [Hyphomonas sp. FCG-A18]